ncbi:MAG: HAD family hydrolase [Roseburia sp.]|nr:HAD family hydrolase [Roseburia sp.]
MKAVFFDLDGTLLPMDQEVFTRGYFRELTKCVAPHGYDPKQLVDAVWKSTAAMVRNDGKASNYDVFWRTFSGIYGKKAYSDIQYFDAFYENEFNTVKELCGHNAQAAETVRFLKSRGITLVLASNPIFPAVAQRARMRWAGIDPEDFAYITSYENSHYCKPDPKYYSEILSVVGLSASDCVMVGNDAVEDTAAESVGISMFMLTDCLINGDNRDISAYRRGGYAELKEFLTESL